MTSNSVSLDAHLHPSNFRFEMVELPETLNPFLSKGVRIFAKMCGGNIKMLPGFELLRAAWESGKLEGVHTVIDNSSGGFAAALGIYAPRFGIKHVKAIIPKDTAPLKMERLRLLGVDYSFPNSDNGKPNGIQEALEKGRQKGWFCTDQYENEGNPRAYEKWFAPQIWEQTKGEITIFAAGLGTCGTIIGTSRYLRKMAENILIAGITPKMPNVPGVRTEAKIVSKNWHDAIDAHGLEEHKASFKNSMRLCRAGIWGGPSSGLAYTGLCGLLGVLIADGTLDKYRNKKTGEVVAVFPCPDAPDLYGEKYSTHLDSDEM